MLLALMAVQGVANLQAQWAIIGEFSNLPQEELLDWILENTQPSESRKTIQIIPRLPEVRAEDPELFCVSSVLTTFTFHRRQQPRLQQLHGNVSSKGEEDQCDKC